jgi:hypothetical protein
MAYLADEPSMISPLEAHALAYFLMTALVRCGVSLSYGFGQAYGR